MRSVTVIGAPCHLGIKPYDDGSARGVNRAPSALRSAGVVEALGAGDAGDVEAEPYRDFIRVPGRPRNEPEMARYSRALADRVAQVLQRGEWPVVLGGDCSVVLGALLALRVCELRRPGLVYIDAHADFANPYESASGSVASMCLALAVGRGDTPLARLSSSAESLVDPAHVTLVGRRDEAASWYGHEALRVSGILDLPDATLNGARYVAALPRVGERLASVDGFWIHVDADVLSPVVMPAVDSPEAGGPGVDDLAQLLQALVAHPDARGIDVTIYDPQLDVDGSSARALVELLTRGLATRPVRRQTLGGPSAASTDERAS